LRLPCHEAPDDGREVVFADRGEQRRHELAGPGAEHHLGGGPHRPDWGDEDVQAGPRGQGDRRRLGLVGFITGVGQRLGGRADSVAHLPGDALVGRVGDDGDLDGAAGAGPRSGARHVPARSRFSLTVNGTPCSGGSSPPR
jgi:hypothetical protein